MGSTYIFDMNDYQRIEKLIRFLEANAVQQPDLALMASHVGLSPFHLHRLFTKWAGITPKSFIKCLTMENAKSQLSAGASVLDAALESGLSGPGRLHDLCVTLHAASPGEIKSGGAGWTLLVGIAPSPFGDCLIGQSPRGICHLSFVEDCDQKTAVEEVQLEWPNAEIKWDQKKISQLAQTIFAGNSDDTLEQKDQRLNLLVKGTQFQVRVWRALLQVPAGTAVSYGRLAKQCGAGGARAVGTAVGQNRIGYLIPCHRVIKATGVVGEYRWGAIRKRAMLAWESIGERE